MTLFFAALVLLARALPLLLIAAARGLCAVLRRLVAPPRCAACDAEAPRAAFCDSCAASVERAAPGAQGEVAFAEYRGAVAVAVRRFKYAGRSDLARPLGLLLRRAVREARLGPSPMHDVGLVVPVPLHPRKLRRRGYNQVALLAAFVADELRAPLAARALVRTRETEAQASLDQAGRRANIAGAFRPRDASAVRGLHVVLVDDVRTTGATSGACRDALLSAGAARVTLVVLARADTPRSSNDP